MGMANREPPRTPAPRYRDTVVCPDCHAEYNPAPGWCRGLRVAEGTENGYFMPLTKIPEGECPICWTPGKGGRCD